jgi:hypothetical protein
MLYFYPEVVEGLNLWIEIQALDHERKQVAGLKLWSLYFYPEVSSRHFVSSREPGPVVLSRGLITPLVSSQEQGLVFLSQVVVFNLSI